MKIRCLPIVLAVLLPAEFLMAQVAPPPGAVQWQLGYEQGFGDATVAATQPATPAWPADVVYHPDATYHVAPNGTDRLSDGSAARPFATFSRALKQIHIDRSKGPGPRLAEISYRADGTYPQVQIVSENHLLIDSYGAANPEQRPVIVSTDVPFLWLNATDIHLQNLRITADPSAGGTQGIYVNGGNDISLDYCEVDGFRTFNLCLIGGAKHVRLHHNYIANSFDPATKTMSCSGLYTECVSPDVECNIFYHNGWRAPFDLNNAPLIEALIFRHGWYENPGGGAVAGIDRFNLYLRNACTGHQCRAGGSAVLWGVFWDNGNAADVFTGAGLSNSLGGEIGHCAFFGNLTPDFACWGGGALGQSAADNFHDLLFAGPATSMSVNPAIIISGHPDAQHVVPAIVNNCRGIWNTGDVKIQDGRTASITHVTIRKPRPGENVPSLLDFFSVNNDQAIADLLRQHLHDSRYSAQTIIDWAGRSLGEN